MLNSIAVIEKNKEVIRNIVKEGFNNQENSVMFTHSYVPSTDPTEINQTYTFLQDEFEDFDEMLRNVKLILNREISVLSIEFYITKEV